MKIVQYAQIKQRIEKIAASVDTGRVPNPTTAFEELIELQGLELQPEDDRKIDNILTKLHDSGYEYI